MEETSLLCSTPSKLGPSKDRRMKMSNSLGNINDFPELILHNILSFLDMKEVVQTSVITKRWRNLWKFQPFLYFNHSCWKKITVEMNMVFEDGRNNEFMEFVDKVLFIPDGGSNVCKFYLHADFYCKEVYVSKWMAELVRRHAEEIYLKIGSRGVELFSGYLMQDEPNELQDEPYELPDCLFTSPLHVFMLQADSSFPDFTYQVPKSMCSAPYLKCLQLASAVLPKGGSEGNLVLSCPLLERLELVKCGFADLNLLTIFTPHLKYLLLENETWGLESSYKIKLNTPELAVFKCKGVFKDYIMENVSSLFRASIFCSSSEELLRTRDINLLNGVCNATSLVIAGWWEFQSPPISSSMLERLPCAFQNLKVLKIAWLRVSRIDLIANLLKKSPYLETLNFGFLEHKAYNDWEEDLSLECSFNHLKSIEIEDYNDCQNDFKFLEFLLRNAMVLESIRVVVKKKISGDEDLVKLRKKLDAVAKASSTANLQIVQVVTPKKKVLFSELWTDIDCQRSKVTIRDGKICNHMGKY